MVPVFFQEVNHIIHHQHLLGFTEGKDVEAKVYFPAQLDLFWFHNVNYPKSVPIEAFHRYITANQVQTDFYYNAYPLASSNDVKSAQRVLTTLTALGGSAVHSTDDEFAQAYDRAVLDLQHDLSPMEKTPIVSLANQAIDERDRIQEMAR